MGSAFGHIISMFGTKGGVGRTTLAANLAVLFGQNGFKAVIVDFDLTAGGAGQVGAKPVLVRNKFEGTFRTPLIC